MSRCFLPIVLSTLGAMSLVAVQPGLTQQAITPDPDGTGTIVTPEGNQYDISGGTPSDDGSNLFHSFETFGLSAEETANFLANPAIQNILGRITGGQASIIDGLIQVSGSPANLYLLNPAGILFGPNAALNLDGSFTATTATGLGFQTGWWQAIGTPDYAALVGNPTSFAFAGETAGPLVNGGNLQVNPGETLTLVGGTVINTGTFTAPGGQVTILAMPKAGLVRIQPQGALLSFELATLPPEAQLESPLPFTPLDLPALLTQSPMQSANSLTVNPDGSVSLIGSDVTLRTEPGATVVSGRVDVANAQGGRVLALGNHVSLQAAEIDASGTEGGGGNILIGGAYQGSGSLPTAITTQVDSQSTLQADGGPNGNGGEIIVWADDQTTVEGTLTARGGSISGDGGLIETSGKQTLTLTSTPDASAPQGNGGTWLIDPTDITILPASETDGTPSTIATESINAALNAGTNVTIDTNAPGLDGGTDIGNIVQFADLPIEKTAGPAVTLTLRAANDIDILGDILSTAAPLTVNLIGDSNGDLSGSITTVGDITTAGGDITFTGGSPIEDFGILILGQLDSQGGDIALTGIPPADSLGALSTGVAMIDGSLLSRGGDIAIEGLGEDGGVSISGTILTEGGNLSILGRAQGGISNGQDFGGPGLIIGGDIDTDGGNIDLVGESFGADPLQFLGFWGLQVGDLANIDAGAGNLALRGTASTADEGIRVEGTLTAEGNITLTADRINLASGLTTLPPEIAGSGQLLIQPETPSADLTIGGAFDPTNGLNDPVTTFLNEAELAAIQDGFSTITLGAADGSGTMTLQGNITFPDPVILRVPEGSGSIQGDGVSITGDTALTLATADSIDLKSLLGNTAIQAANGPLDLTLRADSDGNNLGQVFLDTVTVTTAGGNIDILNAGELSATNLLSQGGNILLTGRAAVTFDTAGFFDVIASTLTTQGGEVTITSQTGRGLTLSDTAITTSGGNVTVTAAAPLQTGVIGNLTIAGGVVETEGGDITVTALRDNSTGVEFLLNSVLSSSGGDLTVNGLATDLSLAFDENGIPFSETAGVFVDETSQLVSGLGTLSLSGTNIADDTAMVVDDQLLTPLNSGLVHRGQINGQGQITLVADGGANVDALFLAPGSAVTSTGEEVLLQADSMNIEGLVSSVTDGTLSLLPLTPDRGISLGNPPVAETLHLAPPELDNLIGFGDILIGSAPGGDVFLGPDAQLGQPTTVFGDQITATGADNTWIIEAEGTGSVNGINFRGASSLVGGPGLDVFTFSENVQVTEDIDSAGGALLFIGAGDLDLSQSTLLSEATLEIRATGDLITGDLSTPGETITLGSETGSITTGNLTTTSPSNSWADGGAVQITAAGGITTGDIDTQSSNGSGGQIQLTSTTQDIVTGNVNASGISGGDITLNAATAISTGTLQTTGTVGDGGTVLLDPSGDIEVSFIDTQSESSAGGAVTVATERFFRATDSFFDRNGLETSIATSGGTTGGNILILHGGNGVVPFVTGDATTNGTAAAISSSNFTLPREEGTVAFSTNTNVGGTDPGNINLITGGGDGSDGGELRPPDPCDAQCRPPDVISPPPQEQQRRTGNAVVTKLPEQPADPALRNADQRLTRAFQEHLALETEIDQVSTSQSQVMLRSIQTQTGQTPAFVFVTFGITDDMIADETTADSAPLELILITPDGEPFYRQIPEASRREVLNTVERLRRQVTNPNLVDTTTYLTAAQRLYRWIIAPLEETLAEEGVTNLGFVMDAGLRSLPIATLHNGERFLIEDYSVGLIPSVALLDTRYRDLRETGVLFGGASQFVTQDPLPATPVEATVIHNLWGGQTVFGADFTADALKQVRQRTPYGIIHLATHGAFLRGNAANSYLQFSNGRLRLDDIRTLGWNDPPVDLVVLSACQTAIGNPEAELGFAGFAVAAGAKTAVASLWKVSDEATAGLMAAFYQQLQKAPIKAEALRQAQLALLRGEVSIEGNQLIWPGGQVDLPADLATEARLTFTHPFFWSAFTMIGSPW